MKVETELSVKARPGLIQLWPYLVFAILVAAYNAVFLRYGFNATDEGWLLSLGRRIVDGQQPYRDFYFLLTPLSVYIQAALIKIFGDGYTVLAARVYWVVQMWAMTTIVSLLYRKYVGHIELLLLLVTGYVVSSMLLSFPWYSYDGVFWSAVALVLFSKRQYAFTGVAAFLAFMSKQNYLALMPLVIILGLILKWAKIELAGINRRSIISMVIGFGIPLAGYLGFLILSGDFSAFITNVFIYPPETSNMSFWFAIFQNNPQALLIALPMIATIAVLFYVPADKWRYALIILIPLTGYVLIQKTGYFVFSLAFFNYAVLAFVLWRLWHGERGEDSESIRHLATIQLFASVIVYLSGCTFGGIIFTYAGSGVALPLAYVLLKKTGATPFRARVALAVILVFLVLGGYYKYRHVYRDAPRSELTAEFQTPGLRGIKSTPRNVAQVDGLVTAAKIHSAPGDYILVYPDFPVLYYLADRNNPTPIEWFYWRGFNKEMLQAAMRALAENPPKLVFVQAYIEDNYLRSGEPLAYLKDSKYPPLYALIRANYHSIDPVGDIFMFVPEF